MVGALANLGHRVSKQTVKNILRRHGIPPAPKRSQVTSWTDFLATHMKVLAGCDFFTVEVLTWRGLVTYYVLFVLHLESRRVSVAGITRHPDQEWMEQISFMSLCFARSRHEVPCLVSFGAGKRRRENDPTASQEPKFECIRGTMGSLGQTGMPVQVDPIR